MRPIDADALMEQIRLMANRTSLGEISLPSIGGLEITGLILNAPTLDVAPVVHAKWKVVEVEATQTRFACSKCGKTVECGNDYFMKPTKHISAIYPYCHCGAKMDLKE